MTADVLTVLVASSDLMSQTTWTKQVTVTNITTGKIFKVWVTKGLSDAASADIVG